MSGPTLAQLVTPSTQPETLALELQTAQNLNLPITSWQPLDPSRTILQIMAQIASDYSQVVAFIAQGGFATTAAAMVDSNGNPVTTWMDLVSSEVYNNTRIAATLAAGSVPVTSVSSTSNSWSPNSPIRFQNTATLATYTSTGSGTIPAKVGSTPGSATVPVQADALWAGNIGTSAAGVVLQLLTPLAGVVANALTAPGLVGADAETNVSLLARDQAKLASLSPNGASGAYVYVAESLPVFGTVLPNGALYTAPTPTYPYGLVTAINRADDVLSIGSGIISVYVANAAGAVPGCAHLAITNVSWSTGTATVTTASAHGLSGGMFVSISGVAGATGVNNSTASNPAWQLVTASGSSFTFALATNPGTYTSGGFVDGGDLGMVNLAIQSSVVPAGQIATVAAASTTSIAVTGTVYISSQFTVPTPTAQTNIGDALTSYFGTVPVGGLNVESNNVVPWSEILTTVAGANKGTVSVVLTSPVADGAIPVNSVPVNPGATFTVVFV